MMRKVPAIPIVPVYVDVSVCTRTSAGSVIIYGWGYTASWYLGHDIPDETRPLDLPGFWECFTYGNRACQSS